MTCWTLSLSGPLNDGDMCNCTHQCADIDKGKRHSSTAGPEQSDVHQKHFKTKLYLLKRKGMSANVTTGKLGIRMERQIQMMSMELMAWQNWTFELDRWSPQLGCEGAGRPMIRGRNKGVQMISRNSQHGQTGLLT